MSWGQYGVVNLGLRDELIQEKKVIVGRDLEGETGFAGGELFLSSGQTGCTMVWGRSLLNWSMGQSDQ